MFVSQDDLMVERLLLSDCRRRYCHGIEHAGLKTKMNVDICLFARLVVRLLLAEVSPIMLVVVVPWKGCLLTMISSHCCSKVLPTLKGILMLIEQ